jgi:hypothetical protein
MGRLFLREVATASHYFVPFLRYYQQWVATEPDLDLTVALERFLTRF